MKQLNHEVHQLTAGFQQRPRGTLSEIDNMIAYVILYDLSNLPFDDVPNKVTFAKSPSDLEQKRLLARSLHEESHIRNQITQLSATRSQVAEFSTLDSTVEKTQVS